MAAAVHEIQFLAKEPRLAPAFSEVVAYFSERPGYRVDEASGRSGLVAYANEDTGVSLSFRASTEPPVVVSLLVPYLKPHIFGLEAEREAHALAARFDFDVIDPHAEGMGRGPYSSDGMLRGYAIANAAEHAKHEALERGEMFVLPSGTLTNAWRWNIQRAALQRALGEHAFVPKVITVAHPKASSELFDAATAIVWSRFMPAFLPFVDVLILTTDELPRPIWIPRADVVDLLETLPVMSPRFRYGTLEPAGLAHYDARSVTPRLTSAIIALARKLGDAPVSDLPRVIPTERVLSKEIARLGSQRMSILPSQARISPPSVRWGLPAQEPALPPETWTLSSSIALLASAASADLVVGLSNDRIAAWDRTNGSLLRSARRAADEHEPGDESCALSGDGRTLVIGDRLGNVCIYDLDAYATSSMVPLAALRAVRSVSRGDASADEPVRAARILGISRQGNVILATDDNDVVVLRDDVDARQEKRGAPPRWEAGSAIALSNDGRKIFVRSVILDALTGAEIAELPDKLETAVVAAFSHDDKQLVFATAKADVALVNLERGLITHKGWFPSGARPTAIAFTPDGARVAITTTNAVHSLMADTLAVERSVMTNGAPSALSAAGLLLAKDDRVNVELWTAGSKRPSKAAPAAPSISAPPPLSRTIVDRDDEKVVETTTSPPPPPRAPVPPPAPAVSSAAAASYQRGLDALAREAPADGIEPFRVAAEAFERELGPTALSAVVARVNHGLALLQCERYNDAVTAFRAVLHTTRTAPPEVKEQVVPALHNLGLALVRSGSPLLALTHLDEALAHRERVVGKDNPLYVDTELVKANALVDLGRLEEARHLIAHAASVALAGGGEEHHLFSEAVFAEARRVSRLGDGLRADALARRALRLAERDAGPDNFTYKDRSTRAARLRTTWRESTRLADPGGARQLCMVTIGHTLRRWRPESLSFDDSGSLPKTWFIDAPLPWSEANARQIRDAVKLLFATSNDDLNAREPDDPNYLDVLDIEVRPLAMNDLFTVDFERAWRDRVWEPSGGYVATAFGLRPITFSELGVIVISRLLVTQRIARADAEEQLMSRFGFDAAGAADIADAPIDADARVVRPS